MLDKSYNIQTYTYCLKWDSIEIQLTIQVHNFNDLSSAREQSMLTHLNIHRIYYSYGRCKITKKFMIPRSFVLRQILQHRIRESYQRLMLF